MADYEDEDYSESTTVEIADIDIDEAEGWLISYADLMTLIACFFILMME